MAGVMPGAGRYPAVGLWWRQGDRFSGAGRGDDSKSWSGGV